MPASAASTASCSTSATATPSRPIATGDLAGALYGVRLGAAFFGESMFHAERDASKVALVHLAARLRACGFKLLDTQFVTEHLAQFGAVELPRHAYKRLLREAIDAQADWQAWPREAAISGAEVLRVLGTEVPA